MNIRLLAVMSLLVCPAPVLAQDGQSFNLGDIYRQQVAAQDNTRVAMPRAVPVGLQRGGQKSAVQPPKDDIKPLVKYDLKNSLKYCNEDQEDCGGKERKGAGGQALPGREEGWLRDFAQTIGNGRCNNRGYNCVAGVLEMCQGLLEEEEITPMYYMACGAMLGKMGERDCEEGRRSCAARLRGALYFSLRAAAACPNSYEEDEEKHAKAKQLMLRFGKEVNKNVGGVYVRKVEQAHSTGHILAWEAGKEVRNIAVEKILEFTFERLAMHGAASAVGAAGGPLIAFAGFMAFHEIAAARMNDEVCTQWNTYYNGSYANVSASLAAMKKTIK